MASVAAPLARPTYLLPSDESGVRRGEIARDWNAKRNEPPIGFVTRFHVRSAFALRYDIQVVGREAEHQELWIPAAQVSELNANLVGPIEVIGHFAGPAFAGEIDPQTHLPTDWR